MGKYAFTPQERWAIWEAHRGCCFWCGEQLPFRAVTIDHIIPESTSDEDLASARVEYGLPRAFALNDFPNWVPSHTTCNSSKKNQRFRASPAMIKAFADAERRSKRARTLAQRAVKNATKAKLLAQLEHARDEGIITIRDVSALFSLAVHAPGSGSVDTPVTSYKVSDVYMVFREGFDDFRVEAVARKEGNATTPIPEMSVECQECGTPNQRPGEPCTKCTITVTSRSVET